MSNWKESLFRISSIPSVIHVLLNLGYNVSGYFSIQNEMAGFHKFIGDITDQVSDFKCNYVCSDQFFCVVWSLINRCHLSCTFQYY